MQCAPPDPSTATERLRARTGDTRPKDGHETPDAPHAGALRAALPHATLSEVFAARDVHPAADGSVAGFVTAHLSGEKPVLWILDRVTRREAGEPYLTGMAAMGLAGPVLRLDLSQARDVLWAAEQALGCSALQAVVAEVWGDPPVLDFTATKRLALRAEAHGVQCWLVRRGGQASLSAARERWRLTSLASLRDPDDARSPGQPLWQAELFRSRYRAPHNWVAHHDAAGGVVLDHGRLGGQFGGHAPQAKTATG